MFFDVQGIVRSAKMTLFFSQKIVGIEILSFVKIVIPYQEKER